MWLVIMKEAHLSAVGFRAVIPYGWSQFKSRAVRCCYPGLTSELRCNDRLTSTNHLQKVCTQWPPALSCNKSSSARTLSQRLGLQSYNVFSQLHDI